MDTLETQEQIDQALLLYHCFKGRLYTIAYSMLKDTSLAEDMVHDTYEILLNHLDQIDQPVYEFLHDYQEEKKKRNGLTLDAYAKQTDNYIYAKAQSYATTILKHKICDLSRKNKKEDTIYVEDYFDTTVGSSETPESLLFQKDLECYMINKIKQLPFPYKDALYLRYYHGYSIEVISNILNKTPANIRKIISRARDMLRNQLQKEGYLYE